MADVTFIAKLVVAAAPFSDVDGLEMGDDILIETQTWPKLCHVSRVARSPVSFQLKPPLVIVS